MPNPSLAEIAQTLGISKMTVSRALRGERHVNPALATQIQQTARHLGYVPDPEVARLMTHLRESRSSKTRQTLAFIWSDPDPVRMRTTWPRLVFSGASQRASELGYDLESFEITPDRMTPARLARILEHRGIHGIIIGPLLSRSRSHLRLPWEKFSAVVIGLGLSSPSLNRVHHHHFKGMHTALHHLKKAGYKRIAHCSSSILDQRMFGAWSASFLIHHPLGPTAATSLLHLPRELQRATFLKWCAATRPDAILDSGNNLAPWIQSLPPDLRPHLATLSWSPDHPHIPGLDQRPETIGHSALDLLAAQLHQNERGIPSYAKTLMIEGTWHPAS